MQLRHLTESVTSKLIQRYIQLFEKYKIAFVYQTQPMCIKSGKLGSTYFRISNGVHQDGVSSPKLFTAYNDDLSQVLDM